MANPKRKHSRTRRDKRRSANSKMTSMSFAKCANCGTLRLPHRVCPSCGYYNGKPVVVIKVKEAKKK